MGAYNPWEDGKEDGDYGDYGDYGDDGEGHGDGGKDMAYVWVNQETNILVGLSNLEAPEGDKFFLVPWVHEWFVPRSKADNSYYWNANNWYEEDWNPIDNPPKKEDGTPKFTFEEVDIVYFGEGAFSRYFRNSQDGSRYWFVAWDDEKEEIVSRANTMGDSKIKIIPWSSSNFKEVVDGQPVDITSEALNSPPQTSTKTYVFDAEFIANEENWKKFDVGYAIWEYFSMREHGWVYTKDVDGD